jgi:hypothetical protein
MSSPIESDREKFHPIEELQSFSSSQRTALRAHWITTVEGLVAAAATEVGRRGLCELLSISRPTLDETLLVARDVIGSVRYDGLRKETPGGPLGALQPRKPDSEGSTDAPKDEGAKE